MNIAQLITNAIGDGTGSGLIRAVKVAYAGWMFCGHHTGSIWNRQCFLNGIDCGIAAFKGRI